MPILATLQRSRRIVIPKEVVEHLGVDIGDVLLFKLLAKGRAVIVAVDVLPREEPEPKAP